MSHAALTETVATEMLLKSHSSQLGDAARCKAHVRRRRGDHTRRRLQHLGIGRVKQGAGVLAGYTRAQAQGRDADVAAADCPAVAALRVVPAKVVGQ